MTTMTDVRNEVRELQSGLTDVVKILGFLQGFIESEFGMRYQFQAYKAASPQHERLENTIKQLQDKFGRCNWVNAALNTSFVGSCPPNTFTTGTPGQLYDGGHEHGPTSTSAPSSYSQTQPRNQYMENTPAGPSPSDSGAAQYRYHHHQYDEQNQAWVPISIDNSKSYHEGRNEQKLSIIMPVNAKDIKTQAQSGDESYPNESCDGHADNDDMDAAGGSTEDTANESTGGNKRKKSSTSSATTKKRRKRKEGTVSREEMKNARMRGEAYIGSLQVERGTGKRQSMMVKPIPSRKLGPTCTSSFCLRSTKRNCSRFTEADRQEIFEDFWKNKDWDEKKAFVGSHSKRIFPQHVRPSETNSKLIRSRTETSLVFLPLNGQRLQVCKSMFENTTGLGKEMLSGWITKFAPAPPESERPVSVKKRKYRKHSERQPSLPKMSKDGSYKCPYCLDFSTTRTDFQSHMAKHMEQFTWSSS